MNKHHSLIKNLIKAEESAQYSDVLAKGPQEVVLELPAQPPVRPPHDRRVAAGCEQQLLEKKRERVSKRYQMMATRA